jgi:hypothetical protein
MKEIILIKSHFKIKIIIKIYKLTNINKIHKMI